MTEFFAMKFQAFVLENLTKILVLVAVWFRTPLGGRREALRDLRQTAPFHADR